MEITDSRANDILRWLDDQAGDHTHLFEQMTRYRDAAALISQLRDAEQSAWHAGLDAGREQGRGKERAGAKDAEIETLKAEVAAQRTRANAMAGEAIKHEARAERLAEAIRDAGKSLRTIASLGGGSEYMMTVGEIRGYASSRATVAEEALRDQEAMNGPAEAAASQTED